MEKKRISKFKKPGTKTDKKASFKENISINKFKNYKYDQTCSDRIRWNSCKILTKFVPKIFPKKSFCTPSLFILNPNEEFHRVQSTKYADKAFFSESNSDNQNSFHSLSESPEKEEKNKNNENELKLELVINENNANSNEEKNSNNHEKDNKLEFDFDSQNNDIIKKTIKENYLSILDVLLMNHK